MTTPPQKLKSPALAAILTFVMPGLGHFYQGRIFKGALYLICIWGTFFFGLNLGQGKVVNLDWHPQRRTWAYTCQLWVGVVAWPAVRQAYGRERDELRPRLTVPLNAAFSGSFDGGGDVVGQLTLQTVNDGQFDRTEGDFTGTLTTAGGPRKISGKLRDVRIEPQVGPDPQRFLEAEFEGKLEGPEEDRQGRLRGSVGRSFFDWYLAQLQDDSDSPNLARPHDPRTALERAHADLGSRFELGVLYTMVAGLLNVLCLFDALEGPAYETDEKEGAKTPPQPAGAAA